MPSWDSIPEDEKPFQRRLMEVAAGFTEHVDVQVGRVVDEIDRLGYGDNTLIFYIWGDNGSSAEGQGGTISELLAQNGIPSTVKQHIAALEELGGLDALGSPKTDPMYHAGWAWAGSTPLQGHQAAGLAFRRHAQPDGRPLAGEDQARCDPAAAVSPRQRRRPDDLRDHRHHAAAHGERRRAGPDRRREFRLLVSTTRRPRADCSPSISKSWAAAPSITTAGWPAPSGRGSRGFRGCRPAFGNGRRTRTSGSSTTWRRTGARPTTSPPKCRKSWRR